MPRETAADKAARYLAEGRLTILHCAGATVYAEVKGSGETYLCGFSEPAGRWVCSCPVTHDRCSHLLALRLVAVRNPRPFPEPARPVPNAAGRRRTVAAKCRDVAAFATPERSPR